MCDKPHLPEVATTLFLLGGTHRLSQVIRMGITDVTPDKNIRGFGRFAIIGGIPGVSCRHSCFIWPKIKN